MRILMMTNTFTPHVGGVARSVESFVEEFRRRGHRVIVVAPEFEGAPANETDVIRIPAIQHFNGSDFSVQLPIPGILDDALAEFEPEIVHSHHPFLLGDTARRIASAYGLPLIFTHHTMYEEYTHYVPGDSHAMKRFIIKLTTGYANICDRVIAPSESVADALKRREVTTPISVLPTGISLERFAKGDRAGVRKLAGIPPRAFVVGHLGRLAPEKNLEFLGRAVAAFLWAEPKAWFLLVGSGPSQERVLEFMKREGLDARIRALPSVKGQGVVDAYHAMDVFAFASKSETQGMVIAEAMASGLPVVALDAPGAREIVCDGVNGRLLMEEGMFRYADALRSVYRAPMMKRRAMISVARKSAAEFSIETTATRALELYKSVLNSRRSKRRRAASNDLWSSAMRLIKSEWEHVQNIAGAAGAAFMAGDDADTELK